MGCIADIAFHGTQVDIIHFSSVTDFATTSLAVDAALDGSFVSNCNVASDVVATCVCSLLRAV